MDLFAQHGIKPPANEAPPVGSMSVPSPRKDLFVDRGISAPSITEQNTNALNAGVDLNNPKTPEQTDIAKVINDDQAQLMTLARSRFTPEKIASFKNNQINFWDAWHYIRPQDVIPGGGLKTAYDIADVAGIAGKMSEGKPLSETESGTIHTYIDREIEMGLRGFDVWGGIAYGAAHLPAFMVEFAVTDGVGKLAQTAAVEATKKVVSKAILAKATGVVANVATRAVAMPTMLAPKLAERRLNNYTAVTDKGEFILKNSQESPAKSALMAFGQTSAEVAGELSGGAIGKYVFEPVGKVLAPAARALKTPMISAATQLPAVVRDNLYQAWKAIQTNATITKMMTLGGWNGMLEEMGEERVTDVMNATLSLAANDKMGSSDGKSFTMGDYLKAVTPSPNQLLIEAGVISIAGGAHASMNAAANLLQSKGLEPGQAREVADNMTAQEHDDFVRENIQTPVSDIPPAEPAERGTLDQNRKDYIARRMEDLHGPDWEQDLADERDSIEVDEEDGTRLSDPGPLEKSYQKLADYADTNPDRATTIGNVRPELVDAVNAFPSRAAFIDAVKRGEVDPRLFATRDQADLEQNTQIQQQELQDLEKKIADQKARGRAKPETIAANQRKADRLGKEIHAANVKNTDSGFFHGEDPNVAPPVEDLEDDEIDHHYGEIYDSVKANTNADPLMGVLLSKLPLQDGGEAEPLMSSLDIQNGQVAAAQKVAPPEVLDEESSFNNSYRRWVDELAPIKNLVRDALARGVEIPVMQNVRLLAETYAGILGAIRQNLTVNTFIKDADGNNILTGKGLKQTMDDFDNMFITVEPARKKRERDFNDYLVAQRYMKDLADRDDVEVTDEQKLKSVADLTRLAEKYGEDFRFFETLGQEIYDFQRRILQNLVSSGVMSQERFDSIVKANPNYIPFDRVIDKKEFGSISSNGIFTNANGNRIIKRIKGSDKEVKNVFASIIKNTAQILDYSARNEVARAISSFAGIMPEQVQKVSPPIVKKGTAKIEISFDPKLREKLEQTVRLLDQRFERKKFMKKGVLGSYSPSEQLVRLRIGSDEGTFAHEVGHMLDYALGLKAKLLGDPAVKQELLKLAEDRLGASIEAIQKKGGEIRFIEKLQGHEASYIEYVKNDAEIIANFFDTFVNSNQLARETAPKAVKAFQALIDSKPEFAFLNDIKPSASRSLEEIEQDVYGESELAPKGTITVFNKGKREYYRVSQPILEAVNGLSPSKLGILEKIFSVPASVLRAGATLIPEFWVRNVLRDQHTAFLQSGVKYDARDFMKGLFAVWGKNDLYNEWERSGGSFNSFMDMDDQGIQKAYEELFRPRGKMARYLVNPIRILEDISGGFEQATRVGVFNAAKRQGQSDVEAATTSRDATLNFSRHGSVGKRVNRTIPFFNAGVQGLDKIVRTFKDHPAETVFWGVATITIPSLLITGYYLYGAPDDDRKEFLEIPEWQRDMFWCVKVGGEWRLYPKPFSYGYIFGTMPEQVITWAYKGDKPEGQELWKSLVFGMGGVLSPVYDLSALIPPLMKVAIEDTTNWDFFRGKHIYPTWMDRLDPTQRFTKGASQTAIEIGKKTGLSPAMIDHTVRGVLAGSGDYVMDGGDQILKAVKKWNGEDVPERPTTAADIPLIKAFAIRRPSGYRSNSSENFYDAWNDVQEKHATVGRLKGAEKDEYLKKNGAAIEQYKTLKDAAASMKDLQSQVDDLYDDTTMKAQDKADKINQLEDQITQIAREANINYSNAVRDK